MTFPRCALHPKGCIYTFITAPFNVTSFLPYFLSRTCNVTIECYDTVVKYCVYSLHL